MMHIKLLTLFILFTNLAIGQVINIEKQRKESNKLVFGTINSSISFEESSSSLWNTSNYAHLNLKKDKHLVMSFTSWDYISRGNDKVQDKGYEHLRYNYMVDSMFTIEVFGQYQFNDIRKIKYRALGGVGIRTSLFSGDSLQWSLGTSAMYDERLFTYDTAVVQQNWRLNLYTNISWDINKSIRFSSIVYYQPAFKDFNNQKLSGEGKLSIAFTKMLGFFVSATISYDSDPPVDVPELYSVLKNGLSIKF